MGHAIAPKVRGNSSGRPAGSSQSAVTLSNLGGYEDLALRFASRMPTYDVDRSVLDPYVLGINTSVSRPAKQAIIMRSAHTRPPSIICTDELSDAVVKSLSMNEPALRHIPMPVRFRATGALRAWGTVIDRAGDAGRRAIEVLATPGGKIVDAIQALIDCTSTHMKVSWEQTDRDEWRSLLYLSTYHLAFWMRNGALYEPTLPLRRLLGSTDLAHDLPFHALTVPCPTLCVVQPSQRRNNDTDSIMVFEQSAAPDRELARRSLTFIAWRDSVHGPIADELTLLIEDEAGSLLDRYQTLANKPEDVSAEWIRSPKVELEQSVVNWPMDLDYLTKVLMYLKLDAAQVSQHTPFSAAPREFPGLGHRKREAKLAEIEQLYDRYIIGPASWCETGLGADGEHLDTGHELAAHWRRGHFRLQSHGPQAALRKLMFIAPTIVRADRLESIIATS